MHALFKVLSFSISTEETRYYLNGVCFEKIGDEINFIATDGHKLTYIDALKNEYCQLGDSDIAEKDFSFIIPRCAIQEFLKVGKFFSDSTTLKFNEKTVSFVSGIDDVIKTYKLIDGTFPQWRKVIPKNLQKVSGFNAKYLAQLCKVLDSEALVLSAEIYSLTLEAVDGKKTPKTKKAKIKHKTDAPFTATNDKGANFVIMPMRN